MSEKYKISDNSFVRVLEEAKVIFTRKSKESQELLKENEKFQKEIAQLKLDNVELIVKEGRLSQQIKVLEEKLDKSEKDLEKSTTELTNSKSFMKNFFTQLRSRITEIEEKGIYTANTFDYLIGDIGRSLRNTSYTVSPTRSPRKKEGNRLSTNKAKKRTRYENIAPIDLTNISNLRETKQDVRVDRKNDTHNAVNKIGKKHQPSLSERNAHINIINNDPNNFLDPNLTLRSPIGPPFCASTPQGPLDVPLKPKETNTTGFHQTSPSLLQREDLEELKSSPLSEILILEDGIPELTEPQSPTIPSRSHSLSKSKLSDVLPQERKTKRKRSFDVSFGSLLAEPERLIRECPVGESRHNDRRNIVTERQKSNENGSIAVQQAGNGPVSSPDAIELEESDFARPRSRSVVLSRKKTADQEECSKNETKPETSSLLLFSPQRSKSPVISSKNSSVGRERGQDNDYSKNFPRYSNSKLKLRYQGEWEPGTFLLLRTVDDGQQKLVFHLNLNDSAMEESSPERNTKEEGKGTGYKYVEVVRGKEKRNKLNGYFCADCEKYYGSLKLSDEEIQERLKACSRHRAKFAPPPGTPEHFWEVDFMNTHDYVEKGYLRNESELPPEKRRLKSRRRKGKIPKYNINNN